MSSCGAGRGRGWLNLSKNSETPKPMGLSPQPITNSMPPLQISRESMELIEKIKEFSINDDGILFNRKMKNVQSFWLQNCSNEEEVRASFEELYNASLKDAELGMKFVTLMSARTFITQNIHDCNLRGQFLKNLQRDFENSNQLQSTSPQMFRNYVNIIGEFYLKARMAHGQPYKVLAAPFLSCLELLLNNKLLPDLILFTSQLFLNGSSLKLMLPDEFPKLGIKIRTLLAVEPQLVKDAKLWLLLGLDLFNLRFGVLPPEVYKYYESQLGTAAMVTFQIVIQKLAAVGKTKLAALDPVAAWANSLAGINNFHYQLQGLPFILKRTVVIANKY